MAFVKLGNRGNYYVRSGTTSPSPTRIDGDYRGYYTVYYQHETNGHTTLRIVTQMQRVIGASGTCGWNSGSYKGTFYGQTKTHSFSSGETQTSGYATLATDNYDIDMTNGNPVTVSGTLQFGGYSINLSYAGFVIPANPYGQSRITSADNMSVDYGEDSSNSSAVFTQYLSDVTHTLNIKYGDVTLKTIQDYSSGEEFNLTNAELSPLYSATSELIPPYTLNLELRTYRNGTQLGNVSTFNIQITVNDLEPSITNITYANDKSSISGDNPIYGISNVTIEADIVTRGSATIKSVLINGENVTSDEIVDNHISHTLEKVITNSYTISVIDSRNISATTSITKGEVILYQNLSYLGNSHRLNPTSGIIVVDLKEATFWSGYFKPDLQNPTVPNALTIKYKIWQGSTIPEEWITLCENITETTSIDIEEGTGEVTIDEENNTYSLTFRTQNIYGYKNAYKLMVLIEDKINTFSPTRTITRGQPVYHWDDKDFYIGNDGDDAKIYLNGEEFNPVPPIDDAMSDTSENAVQNKVIKNYIDGEILFEGSSYGDITLPKSATDYKIFEVFYHTNNSYKSSRVFNPNNKYILLDWCGKRNLNATQTDYYYCCLIIKVQGTSITKGNNYCDNYGWTTSSNHCSQYNAITIDAIVGYK